mgnify:CR=1 FL=1
MPHTVPNRPTNGAAEPTDASTVSPDSSCAVVRSIERRGRQWVVVTTNGVIDSVRSIVEPTPAGDWNSVCLCSDGSYGIEKGLMFSYPIRSDGKKWDIVQGVPVNDFSRAKITATENELKEEKSLVSDLLPK